MSTFSFISVKLDLLAVIPGQHERVGGRLIITTFTAVISLMLFFMLFRYCIQILCFHYHSNLLVSEAVMLS